MTGRPGSESSTGVWSDPPGEPQGSPCGTRTEVDGPPGPLSYRRFDGVSFLQSQGLRNEKSFPCFQASLSPDPMSRRHCTRQSATPQSERAFLLWGRTGTPTRPTMHPESSVFGDLEGAGGCGALSSIPDPSLLPGVHLGQSLPLRGHLFVKVVPTWGLPIL